MAKVRLPENVTSVSHEGAQFDADETGCIEVDTAHSRRLEWLLGIGAKVVENETSGDSGDDGLAGSNSEDAEGRTGRKRR